MAGQEHSSTSAPPAAATSAVLLASEPVPQGTRPVQGLDFNAYQTADITVAELVEGMGSMGFQASAISDAVRIINEMVRLATAVCLMERSSDPGAASVERPGDG